MVASCTPCDSSPTVSRSGHFVASMRLLQVGQVRLWNVQIAGNIRRQDLERYVAPQLHIGRAIHLTHSARANCGVDPVMCKCTSDQTQPPRVATHQLFVPEPRQQSYSSWLRLRDLVPSHASAFSEARPW